MELLETFALTTILIFGGICCYYAYTVQSLYSRMLDLEFEIENLKDKTK